MAKGQRGASKEPVLQNMDDEQLRIAILVQLGGGAQKTEEELMRDINHDKAGEGLKIKDAAALQTGLGTLVTRGDIVPSGNKYKRVLRK